jgi:hypothetical protein
MSNINSDNKGKKPSNKNLQVLHEPREVGYGVTVTRAKPLISKQPIKRNNRITPNLRKILANINVNCENAHKQLEERSTYIVNSYVNLIHLRVVMGASLGETITEDHHSDQRLHDLYAMLQEHTACGLPSRFGNTSNAST